MGIGGPIQQILMGVITLVVGMSLMGVIGTSTTTAKTALSTNFASAAALIDLVPLVVAAGLIVAALGLLVSGGYGIYRRFR